MIEMDEKKWEGLFKTASENLGMSPEELKENLRCTVNEQHGPMIVPMGPDAGVLLILHDEDQLESLKKTGWWDGSEAGQE